jgi:hypothetical protein
MADEARKGQRTSAVRINSIVIEAVSLTIADCANSRNLSNSRNASPSNAFTCHPGGGGGKAASSAADVEVGTDADDADDADAAFVVPFAFPFRLGILIIAKARGLMLYLGETKTIVGRDSALRVYEQARRRRERPNRGKGRPAARPRPTKQRSS